MPIPSSDPALIFEGKDGTTYEQSSGSISGTAAAETFYVSGSGTGNEVLKLTGFGKTDLLVLDSALVDNNGDGYITFGKNGFLDRDGPDAGQDKIQFIGGPKASVGLRIIGDDGNGHFAYADASVRLELDKNVDRVVEGKLGNDALSGSLTSTDHFLFDTALDLAWGKDTITNFGDEDFIVTTTAIFDGNGDETISFINGRLDLNGNPDVDPSHGGNQNQKSPWGQVTITDECGAFVTELDLVKTEVYNGVKYYFYGTGASDSLISA